jgi:uncharacterized membrane protein YkvA (DUF1232 family)
MSELAVSTLQKSKAVPLWVIIVICLVYLISPIDLLPDVIPVLGQADDLLVLALTVVESCRRGMATTRS